MFMFIKRPRERENMRTIILKYELAERRAETFMCCLRYFCCLWLKGLRKGCLEKTTEVCRKVSTVGHFAHVTGIRLMCVRVNVN
jgi:hypothetical protein